MSASHFCAAQHFYIDKMINKSDIFNYIDFYRILEILRTMCRTVKPESR
jgi:hypothetical protein